jgi:hypothetical protein
MTATSVFIGLLILSIHDPAGPQNPQAETTGRRVSITKNVPILRIDHASIKGKLLGVWQISYIGGVLDLEEINRRLVRSWELFYSETRCSNPYRRVPRIRAQNRTPLKDNDHIKRSTHNDQKHQARSYSTSNINKSDDIDTRPSRANSPSRLRIVRATREGRPRTR